MKTQDVRTLTALEARHLSHNGPHSVLEAFRLAVNAEIYGAAILRHEAFTADFAELDDSVSKVIRAQKTITRELRARGFRVTSTCGTDLHVEWRRK